MNNHSPVRRLNPFLFPADTDFRFLLLIAAVIGASLFVYRSLANAWLRAEFGQMILKCAFDKACWGPFERKESLLITGGVLAVLLVASVIYWVTPWWIIRRRHLTALTSDDGPEMVLFLNTLCQQMGLCYTPLFLIDPLNSSVSGLAFGRKGRYYVALTGGLIRYYYTDPPAFQAVVLHELAHLKNADVDKTYFTMAIWYAFLMAAVIPFAISLVAEIARFGASEFALSIQLVWRAVVLAVLVYAVRNSVLRIREFYADVRAIAHLGSTEPLARVFAKLSPPSHWQLFGALHPQPEQRKQVMVDTTPLFRVGFGAALSSGLAIAVAIHNTIFWLTLFLPAQNESAAYPLALVVFAPLAIGVLGLGMWRNRFATITLGNSPQSLGWIGLGFGLGLVTGRILSFDAATKASAMNDHWLAALVSDLCWGMFLVALLYLFLRWAQAGATAWLATAYSPSSLRRIYSTSFIIYASLLSWWLWGLLLATEVSRDLATESLAAIPIVGQRFFARFVIGWPLGILSLLIIFAFPVIGWFMHRRKGASLDMHWAFLDTAPGQAILLDERNVERVR